MPNKVRISIIIPIYNVEKYLSKCLDSIFLQSIPLSDYEVICINDCSPDNSRDIIIEYKKKYENLVLIEHEKNSKQGAARNTGLKVARGEYIWFVDSDDYIGENSINQLLFILEKDNLDVLHFNAQVFTKDGICNDYNSFPIETDVITGYKFHEENDYRKYTHEPWGQIYKKSLLLDNHLFFAEETFYEDALHTLQASLLSKRYKSVTNTFYFYRKNDSSVVNKTYRDGTIMAMKALKLVERMYFINDNYPRLQSVIDFCIIHLSRVAKMFFTLPKRERELFIERIGCLNINNIKMYFPFRLYLFYKYLFAFKLLNPLLIITEKSYKNIQKIKR